MKINITKDAIVNKIISDISKNIQFILKQNNNDNNSNNNNENKLNEESKNFYVYMIYNYNWKVPFYVGKGSGDRYKDYHTRNKIITAICSHYDCNSVILIEDLTETDSYELEDFIKQEFLNVGFPIMDFEKTHFKKAQRIGIEEAKRKGIKFGRKEIETPKNWYKVICQWEKNEITGKKAMEMLGLKKNSFYKLVKKYGIEKEKVK